MKSTMRSPPASRPNTRLTKTRIFPTTVMVQPPSVGPLLPRPFSRKPHSPHGAGVLSAERFSPENERGGTMPPPFSAVNANLTRLSSAPRPFGEDGRKRFRHSFSFGTALGGTLRQE